MSRETACPDEFISDFRQDEEDYMKKGIISIALAALASLVVFAVFAVSYKAVVPQLSPASTAAYAGLVTEALKAEGVAEKPEIMPFARCVYLLENKQADILYPIIAIPDKTKWKNVKYDYSVTETHKIVFVLYSNKNKPVTVVELKKGNARKVTIETDSAHTDYFNFALSPSNSIDGSLQKLENGQIDGYIFSQASTDAALKRLGLKNIQREYFDTYVGVFGIAKGTRGGAIDKLLARGLAKIKASGKYQELLGDIIKAGSKYIDWQP
jgi:polar amino acid transport system substrate-binding protein